MSFVRVGNPAYLQPPPRLARMSAQSFGGFSPLNIPGLAAWYDASQITGLADAATVATWSDLSGNGNHLAQATEAAKPTWQDNELNGKPTVLFDGVDDFMTKASFSGVPPDTYTAIWVAKMILGGDDVQAFFDLNNGGGTNTGLSSLISAGAVTVRGCDSLGTVNPSNTSDDRDDTCHIYIGQCTGSVLSAWRDGVPFTTTDQTFTPPNPNGLTQLDMAKLLGAPGFFLLGHMAEMVIYDNAISVADLNALGGDRAGKWGATWTTVS